MTITIYHNPACGTSRTVLELIRDVGHEPFIIEYLKAPPSRTELASLIACMKLPVRELMRRKGTPYEELDLDNKKWSDNQLLDHIIAHPILMNRPIVVTPLGAMLCRPPEKVLTLLPKAA